MVSAAAATGKARVLVARLGLIGPPRQESPEEESDHAGRRDWLSLLLCAVGTTGASPAGLCAGKRGVAVLPVDMAAAALASEAAKGTPADGTPREEAQIPSRIMHLDAAAFGLQPRLLSSLLDQVEASRGPAQPPLLREVPYPEWRRLVAAAGSPAVLALAMLPPAGRGGALQLPSGARRRLRDRDWIRTAKKHTISSLLSTRTGLVGSRAEACDVITAGRGD